MRNERSISPDTELKNLSAKTPGPHRDSVRKKRAGPLLPTAEEGHLPKAGSRSPDRATISRRTSDNDSGKVRRELVTPSSKEASKQAFRRRTLPFRATFPERSAVRRDRCSGRPIRHGTDRRLFLTISPPTGKSPSGVILISGGPSDRRSDSGRKAHHSPRHGIQTS